MKMSKKNNVIQRALRKARRSAVLIGSAEAYDILCGDGYTSLDQNPEIVAACQDCRSGWSNDDSRHGEHRTG